MRKVRGGKNGQYREEIDRLRLFIFENFPILKQKYPNIYFNSESVLRCGFYARSRHLVKEAARAIEILQKDDKDLSLKELAAKVMWTEGICPIASDITSKLFKDLISEEA